MINDRTYSTSIQTTLKSGEGPAGKHRGKKRKVYKCENCRVVVDPLDNYCQECGKRFVS